MACNDVMVDLETLATTADAAIISIGAVKFDLSSDELDNDGFYASVSMESNIDYGRRISEDTMRWWMQQSEDARKVFTEPKQGIDDALEAFTSWLVNGETDPVKRAIAMKDTRIWSNGANFDEPILAHALTQCRMEIPWKFWNVRCFRTFKNLPGAKDINVARVGVHHNAVADALTQAKVAQAIYAKLFMRTARRVEVAA